MKLPINGALALAALPILVSCGAVVPDPVAEGAKDTYVIHMVVGSRGPVSSRRTPRGTDASCGALSSRTKAKGTHPLPFCFAAWERMGLAA